MTDTDWLKVEPVNAGWVRRRSDHRCQQPMREAIRRARPGDLGGIELVPDGAAGDLWRCGCGRLWEITDGLLVTYWCRASLWSRLTWWLP